MHSSATRGRCVAFVVAVFLAPLLSGCTTPPPGEGALGATCKQATKPAGAIEVRPDQAGTDQHILLRAARSAPAGAILWVMGSGYNQQGMEDVDNPITIIGAPGSALKRLTVRGVRNITFRCLHIRGYTSWGGIEVQMGSANLRFEYVTIDANTAPVVCGINANTVRGFQIGSKPPTDPTNWPANITLTESDVFGATVDLVTIYEGGNDVKITRSRLHHFRSGTCDVNDEHNDAIQILRVKKLEISGNDIFSPPGRRTGPDQAIMMEADDPSESVTEVTVTNNRIYDWPGTGIIATGVYFDGLTVTGNTVRCAWGGINVHDSVRNATVANNVVELEACPGAPAPAA